MKNTTSDKKNVLKVFVMLTLGAGVLLGPAACNTTEGVGKDIKSAGKGIEETAQDAK